jgi:hypothetical protein
MPNSNHNLDCHPVAHQQQNEPLHMSIDDGHKVLYSENSRKKEYQSLAPSQGGQSTKVHGTSYGDHGSGTNPSTNEHMYPSIPGLFGQKKYEDRLNHAVELFRVMRRWLILECLNVAGFGQNDATTDALLIELFEKKLQSLQGGSELGK